MGVPPGHGIKEYQKVLQLPEILELAPPLTSPGSYVNEQVWPCTFPLTKRSKQISRKGVT